MSFLQFGNSKKKLHSVHEEIRSMCFSCVYCSCVSVVVLEAVIIKENTSTAIKDYILL